MKQIKTILALCIAILVFEGCSKDTDPYPESAVPSWSVQSPELLPNSFTAIVAIPDEINIYAGDEDKIAAFIGDECRGVGNLVKSESTGERVYYITIRAADTENRAIVFMYYNARLSYMYQALQSVPFENDGTWGTHDSPVILDLEYVTD
ncbi:hypothetical protein SAMN05444280_11825 [Tangfeifania diversioriginum]|uniref:Uncharacterized protein n=1 Tax=Tangfeifania diversioriginum TaxID=1168035 RepID=A0A1M6IX98_9BACT|nr:hypothetical protein [Tangfeifania diversioriginum]SHJ39063.1 hypothetical protein SAMN05444280_11825 [Tangfeifania diversioriginum]